MTAGAKTLINTGILYTDRLKQYLNEKRLGELFSNSAVFTQFSKKMKMAKTMSPDFKMFEYNNPYWNPSCTIALSSGSLPAANNYTALNAENSVTIAAASNMPITEGIVLNVYTASDPSTAEYIGQCRIHSSTSVKWLHVATAFQGSSATTTRHAFVVNHAAGEFSLSPNVHYDEMTLIYNSTGIRKTALSISGTLEQAALRGESKELLWERAKKLKEHVIKGEKGYLLSRRIGGMFNDATGTTAHITDSGTNQVRTSHGVIPCIEDWHADYGTGTLGNTYGPTVFTINPNTYGWGAFKDDTKEMFKYSNDMATKYVFCGDELLSFFNDITGGPMGALTGRVQISQDMAGFEKFGFNVRAFETPFGILKLVRNPLMTLTENGRYSGYGVVIDPENIGHVTYRASKYETAIQENDRDGIKDQYFSDDGIWLGNMMTHNIIKLGAAA